MVMFHFYLSNFFIHKNSSLSMNSKDEFSIVLRHRSDAGMPPQVMNAALESIEAAIKSHEERKTKEAGSHSHM